ncbi:hypothetical protein BJY00DRAFT_316183 [Aspergillus carlsbadensis]|nr:hypothetical protein BJY00DRAFT_316183 [Aspergillus carlsbadensis]
MCNTTEVSIKDLPKLPLLHALWQHSPPAIFYENRNVPPPSWDAEEAQQIAKRFNWSFDYVRGRVIKSDLSGDEVNPEWYDRDNGKGAFAEVVREFRERDQAGHMEGEASPETGSVEVEQSKENEDDLDEILLMVARADIGSEIRERKDKEDAAEGEEEDKPEEQSLG